MPIRSRYNQYHGINAHLQSAFQNQGHWRGFHTAHLAHIHDQLAPALTDEYYVLMEESLQFREINLFTGTEHHIETVGDVVVYSDSYPPVAQQSTIATALASETYTVAETLVDEKELMSLVIYKVISSDDDDLRPVTRIELLSPANKPPGSHRSAYAKRRTATLSDSINLIELDYLHERRSPAAVLPSDSDRQRGAFPYHILVSNPHPDVETGLTHMHGFRVDVPVPVIDIPLDGDDSVQFDFGAVYNITFSRGAYFHRRLVDYAELPINFETYDTEDRRRIKQRMSVIKATIDAGEPLPEAPIALQEE